MASQSPDGKNSVENMSNDSTQNSSEKPPIGSGSKRKRVVSPSDKVFVIIEPVFEHSLGLAQNDQLLLKTCSM